MDASTTIPASTMSVIIAHFARHAGLALGPAILMQVSFLLCELVIRENPRGMQHRELPDAPEKDLSASLTRGGGRRL
jgi:hypothetical protein